MLDSLTFSLLLTPVRAWPRLREACANEVPLPEAVAPCALVGSGSVLATLLGACQRAGATTGSVVVATLAAVAGYIGAGAAVTSLVPRLAGEPRERAALLSRFASAAALPVAASGVLNVVPLAAWSVFATLVGGALTYRSGSLGARDFLGMEGAQGRRAVTLTTLVATLPVLAATVFVASRS